MFGRPTLGRNNQLISSTPKRWIYKMNALFARGRTSKRSHLMGEMVLLCLGEGVSMSLLWSGWTWWRWLFPLCLYVYLRVLLTPHQQVDFCKVYFIEMKHIPLILLSIKRHHLRNKFSGLHALFCSRSIVPPSFLQFTVLSTNTDNRVEGA